MVQVFKEGGERREKNASRPYAPHPTPVFQFLSPSTGKRLPVVEGLALVWEEIACMSWKEPVYGAQDKDVRPDKESSCWECLQ